MVTDLERDPFECIRSGDRVEVDADAGVVRVGEHVLGGRT
jgi:hypothetical protein